MEEWREKINPTVLRELNRRRVAKGRPRIRGPHTGRPLTGFLRYAYKNTHLKATTLNNVPVTSRRYEETFLGHKRAAAITLRLWLNGPGASGGQ